MIQQVDAPRVVVLDPPGVAAAVASCWSTALVYDRQGQPGRGFLNLKRLLGHPLHFRLVIKELARSVPPGVAVAACDEGAWPLVGALVVELGTPGVLVRREPKSTSLPMVMIRRWAIRGWPGNAWIRG